jgi:hypothetical protein
MIIKHKLKILYISKIYLINNNTSNNNNSSKYIYNKSILKSTKISTIYIHTQIIIKMDKYIYKIYRNYKIIISISIIIIIIINELKIIFIG